jgi:putative DNA primase/helicase
MTARPPGYASWPRAKQDAWYAWELASEGTPPNGHDGLQAPQVITRRASEINPEPIAWVWKHWLARGKLHIIAGVPETGKTTIALSYAAINSSGATWPDGTRAIVGSVLIWTSEDDADDTLVPRLMRMDADLDRIHFIEETIPPGAKSRPFNPSIDMPSSKRRRLSAMLRC